MLMKNCSVVILLSVAIFLLSSCAPRFLQIRRAELLYKEGQILLSKGKGEEAMLKFEKSLSLAREAGFKAGMAHNLNEMAIIHTARGEYAEARELLAKAVEIYKEFNMEPEVSKSLNNVGEMIGYGEVSLDDIWDALRVNISEWPDIGNNNLEIVIDGQGNYFSNPIDVVYIPMSRMLWKEKDNEVAQGL